VLLIAIACAGIGAEVSSNWHTVIPGRVYRSAQLNPASLERAITGHQLRSILNLRGANPDDAWYVDECEVAARHGIRHYDVPLDSLTPPGGAELRELIDLLDSCPKPLLIHCYSGIDRSGFVAAICVLLYDEQASPQDALSQLGFRFGHLPWQENQAKLNAWMAQYQDWLVQRGWTHSPEHFRAWASQD
jgi:hypothetical protein